MIICDIEFKNFVEFFKCLDYARPASRAFIAKKYGSYENLLKVRLKDNDLDSCKKKLLALRDKYRNFQAEKKNHFEVSINKDVLDILIIIYKLIDESQRDNALKTYCLTRQRDEIELNDKIRQVLEKWESSRKGSKLEELLR